MRIRAPAFRRARRSCSRVSAQASTRTMLAGRRARRCRRWPYVRHPHRAAAGGCPGGDGLHRRGGLDVVGFGACAPQVVLHLGLQVLAPRTEDGLHAVADDHDPGCTERFQRVGAGLRHISKRDAKPGDAGIEADDVRSAAERAHQLQRELVARDRAGGCCRLVLQLASGGEQVEPPDRERKDAVIHGRPRAAR